VYNTFSLIHSTELYYGLFIGIAMIIGSWFGKKIIEKVSKRVCIIIIEILLIISGMHMIVMEFL
jgi:hypothetical protein